MWRRVHLVFSVRRPTLTRRVLPQGNSAHTRGLSHDRALRRFPRPSSRRSLEALRYRILSRMSRPRFAALRLAAGRSNRLSRGGVAGRKYRLEGLYTPG